MVMAITSLFPELKHCAATVMGTPHRIETTSQWSTCDEEVDHCRRRSGLPDDHVVGARVSGLFNVEWNTDEMQYECP
jgi:hypothetical protein